MYLGSWTFYSTQDEASEVIWDYGEGGSPGTVHNPGCVNSTIYLRANGDNIGRHKEFDILVQTFGNTEKFGGDICIGSNLSNLDKCFIRGRENL